MPDITLLMPFDTGLSYAVPPDFRWAKVLTQADHQSGWEPVVLPYYLKQPLGESIRLRIPPGDAAWTAEATGGWLQPGFELEALFFPVGIGVLILKGQWSGKEEEKWKSFDVWQYHSDARFGPVAQRAAQSFAVLADRVGFQVLPQVKRGVESLEFPWTYPLFFGGTATTTGSEPEVLAKRSLERVPVDIRWKGADIRVGRGESEFAAEIEWFFVVASVTWEGLSIIDGLLSRLLGELGYQPPQGRPQHSDNAYELQQVRLFCKQVVDGARALRWTIVRDRLELLEGILSAWSTSQMWQSIDDKTSLLVLIHEQHEDQAREATGALVGYVALLITIISTVSAVADFFTFVDPQGSLLPLGWRRTVAALLFPGAIGAITATLLGFRRFRRSLRR